MTRRPVALIADDDIAHRLLLCDAALEAGFEVIEAADGAEALAKGTSHHVDVMLLDVEMPKLSGFDVCRELRKLSRLQSTPILVITGHDDPQSIERAYEAGATDFMPKPLNWPLVPHRLTYVLRNARIEEKVRRMAYFDTTTGLPNRQSFIEFVAEASTAADTQPPACQVTVVKIWASGIERISQSLGREIADAAIISFARRLMILRDQSETLDRQLCVARIEGSRFAVCVREPAGQNGALALAAAIQEDFESPVIFREHSFFLKPAIGLAQYPAHGPTTTELMMNADVALQQSNASLSAAPVMYTQAIGEQSRRLLKLDSELRRAVRDEQLTLYYQPKFRLTDGRLAGVEALLRWFHPDLGAIPPQQFISLAEESGLILELGNWVIRCAFRQLRNWHDAGLVTNMAVNFAAPQFIYADPARVISDAAAASNIEPKRMIVEITESALIRDWKLVRTGIAAVRELGCQVSIDDFGTGYSSLAYLKALQADELKVDRVFIQRVDQDQTDAAIYTAVMSLARQLNLRVTAEGVETQGQLDWLRTEGCDEAQGYLLSKPLPGHDILALYRDESTTVFKVA